MQFIDNLEITVQIVKLNFALQQIFDFTRVHFWSSPLSPLFVRVHITSCHRVPFIVMDRKIENVVIF